MNSIYQSVWNEASGAFVAVSEHASGAMKNRSSGTGPGGAAAPAMTSLALALALMTTGACAWAGPVGGVVVAGGANIGGAPGSMVITQTTQNAVLNWQSFNVASGESVRFVQPNSNAVALNRVLGSEPSSILGSLSANGKVFLVNPNGVLFGKGASVNVGGLVASSLDIGDADFMAGHYRFSGSGEGAVANLGAINAPGGYVALLGAHVGNDGVITARLGSVALAAGSAMTLDVAGDGLLNVAIDGGAVSALARNGGLIQADGGQVVLSARAAGGLLQGGVNNSGVIEARTLDNRGGTIRLLGDAVTGQVDVTGTLDASGRGAGQTGGAVQVLGSAVNLTGALVDVSGDAGGGLAQIGGNFHGDGLPSAHGTVIDGAVVHADAVTSGDGGRIAVWSDGATAVNAQLTARGGATGGDGGMIETSGATVKLGAGNRVDTLAPHGKTGTWLLDPVDWTIAEHGGDETPGNVATSLALSDRLISATNDITVADPVVWTTGQKLELNALHNVNINASMTASTNNSAIVLTAGNDVLVDAALTASALGSRIALTAGRDVIATAAVVATGTGAKVVMVAGRDVGTATVTSDGGGSVDLVAGRNVTASDKISADTGAVTMIADNDGTGPASTDSTAGTVLFVGPASVSAQSTTIRFNPVTYAATSTEIANYVTKVTSGAVDARAWAFAQGDNKVYDGQVGATLSLRGNPQVDNDVSLVAGHAAFADANVGNTKAIAFNGYTLAGADQAKFALFAPYGSLAGSGSTTANITPAPLTITANSATKTYGETVALPSSAFTPGGLVPDETIGGVTETSAGTGATASVIGSAYAIVPSNAAGGTFSPSNYAITYVNGTLAVTPAPLTVQAADVSKIYGATVAPTAFTVSGLVNLDTIGSVSEASTGSAAGAGVAGGPYAIVPSTATGGTFTPSNYAITYLNGALTVAPAALLVKADDVTKAYGDIAILGGFTATGLANHERIGSVIETSSGAGAGAAARSYAITASGAAGGTFTPSNYAIRYSSGVLTVRAAVVAPPVVTPPVIVPPVVTPPVVVPPVVIPPVVTPPVVVPPVVAPPVITPPVVSPPVVVPPVSVPPVVVPIVVPVVTPVVTPPVATPPVVVDVQPVITPPAAPPVTVTPAAPASGSGTHANAAPVAPLLSPVAGVPAMAAKASGMIVIQAAAMPTELQSLVAPRAVTIAQAAPAQAVPAAEALPVSDAAHTDPAVTAPRHRARKQDRN